MDRRILEDIGRLSRGTTMAFRVLIEAMIEEYRNEMESVDTEVKFRRQQGGVMALRDVLRKLDQAGEH